MPTKYCHCRVPCNCKPNTTVINSVLPITKVQPVSNVTPLPTKPKKSVKLHQCNVGQSCSSTPTNTISGSVEGKCSTTKIKAITKVKNKILVTLDDCTYFEAEPSVVDKAKFLDVEEVVVSTNYDKDTSTLTVVTKNLVNNTSRESTYIIESSGAVIPLTEDIHVTGGGLSSETDNTLLLYLNKGNPIEIDVTKLNNKNVTVPKINTGNLKIKSTALNEDYIYTITLEDDTSFNTDFSRLADVDKYVHSGTVIKGNKLELTFNDRTKIEIDLSGLNVATSAVSSIIIDGGRIEGTNLILSLSNGTEVTVDITELLKQAVNQVTKNIQEKVINDATQYVINNILNLGYRINTQNEDYTLTSDDFDGRTLVRMNKNGNQVLTVPKPESEDFIGRAVLIRKTAGAAGSLLTFQAGEGVTINPVDISPLRRIGSSATLVYVGNGIWDSFGELP